MRTISAVIRLVLAPALLLALLAPQPAPAKETLVHGQGLLFKISTGTVAPSHVFGTMHSSDPEVLYVPVPVARAFAQSSRLALEIVFGPETNIRMQEAMLLPDGRTLSDIVGAELFSRVANRAAAIGLEPAQLNRLKPWAAGLIVSRSATAPNRRATGPVTMDQALQLVAASRGIRVYGLETIEEQIAAFSELPEKEQVAALRISIEMSRQAESPLAEMKKAYLIGDLDRLHDLAWARLAAHDEHLAELYEDRFVVQRNRRIVKRMVPHVKEGGAFIAVGALHLSGENGVLRLLELRGYTVERIF